MPAPSVDEFIERFPEFADSNEDAIQLALDDASAEVSENVWSEGDYVAGVLFLAAHFFVAGTQQADFVADGGPPIKSESIGRLSTTYGDQITSSSTGLGTTEYGARFLRLRKRNVPRILVI